MQATAIESLHETLARRLRDWQIARGPVVVALSGGPDSVALFRSLHALLGSSQIVAAHLHHGLRGGLADRDAAFVAELCHRLDVPLSMRRRDVAAHARRARESVELTARRHRYAFLAAAARRCGAPFVAVAHHADDQVETILHRMLRGTGLRGLAGMPARRPLTRTVDLVRPLLDIGRGEILAYLSALGQNYVVDETNERLEVTRNRLRHDLIARLEADYNPRVRAGLLRLARHAAEAQQLLDAQAQPALEHATLHREPACCILDVARLAGLPGALLRACLVLLWQQQRWPMRRMSGAHWDRLASLSCAHREDNAACSLPGGIDARRAGGRLVLRRKD